MSDTVRIHTSGMKYLPLAVCVFIHFGMHAPINGWVWFLVVLVVLG